MASRFNPYRQFVGSFIPNWLMERTEVSPGAKLTYARLAQYATKHGVAYPKLETLAADLGVSSRSVQNYIAELERHELLESEQPGLGQSNRYYFLRHGWMDDSVSGLDWQDSSTPEWTDSSTPDQQDSSTPIPKRISRRESVEESSTPPRKQRTLELRAGFIDEACVKYPQWDREKVERLVESAVNYYLPEMRKGKYQDLNLCVWNNLADKAEKELANGHHTPQQVSAAPRLAGGASRPGASEWTPEQQAALSKRGF